MTEEEYDNTIDEMINEYNDTHIFTPEFKNHRHVIIRRSSINMGKPILKQETIKPKITVKNSKKGGESRSNKDSENNFF